MGQSPYANRGSTLEALIERTIQSYRANGIMCIQKIHGPWVPVRQNGRVVNAWPKKSTVDFMGAYKGVPVAFDAKENNIRTRFPWNNVKPEQVEFMEAMREHGSIVGLLVAWWSVDTMFFAPLPTWIDHYYRAERDEGRKSVPLDMAQDEWMTVRTELPGLNLQATFDALLEE